MGRPKLITPAGSRFGRLIVTGPHRVKNRNVVTLCRCDCGNTTEVACANLRSGTTLSCGCLKSFLPKLRATHGHAGKHGVRTLTYSVWTNMWSRCTNPNVTNWLTYGGRGIRVCDRWGQFENFLSDMGERPSGMSLDRYPDVNGNYEPGNCRWATAEEQQNNTTRNHMVEFNGKTQTVAQWASEMGVSPAVLYGRITRNGWSIERALTQPKRRSPTLGVTYKGKTQSIPAWAKEIGIAYITLKKRIIDQGWPIDEAMEKPVRKW